MQLALQRATLVRAAARPSNLSAPRGCVAVRRPSHRLVTRILVIAAVVIATLAAAGVGALAWADGAAEGKLPAGSKVSGVDVGGLTRDEALERAQRRVSARIARPVNVQLGAIRYTLTPEQAGVKVDPADAVAQGLRRRARGLVHRARLAQDLRQEGRPRPAGARRRRPRRRSALHRPHREEAVAASRSMPRSS